MGTVIVRSYWVELVAIGVIGFIIGEKVAEKKYAKQIQSDIPTPEQPKKKNVKYEDGKIIFDLGKK